MADIRLSKIIRQFNIGLDILVDFLHRQGVEVEANPNAKVSDELLPAIGKQFGKDLELKQAADKVDVKITEIIEKNNKKRSRDIEEEEEPEHETIIKSNTFFNPKKEQVAEPQPEEPAETLQPEPEPAHEEPETHEPEAAAEPAVPAADSVAEPEEEAPAASVQEASEAVQEVPAAPETAEPSAQPETEPAARAEESAEPEAAAQAVEPAESKPADAKAEEAGGVGLKVVGKIDLSQFKKPAKKRERISKGTQKVDVAKAGANIEKSPKKDANRQGAAQQQSQKSRKDRNKARFKPALSESEQEELQKEIQKQVKETYAKMNEGKKNNFGAKYRKEKREAAAQRTQEEQAELTLPAGQELVEVRDQMEAVGLSNCAVTAFHSRAPQIPAEWATPERLDTLNCLAIRLTVLADRDPLQLVKYKAVLEASPPVSLEEAMALTERLDAYSLDRSAASPEDVARGELRSAIGEEQAALSSTAVNPFVDTPAWCDRYVAYAFEKSYTNGVGESASGALYFAPDRQISAEEYMTLILRALGYTDSGAAPDFTWDTALSKAVSWGILSSGEQAMLSQSQFLRAQVVYLSYFALNAPMKGGGVLLDRTVSSGGLNRSQLEQVMAAVTVPRGPRVLSVRRDRVEGEEFW